MQKRQSCLSEADTEGSMQTSAVLVEQLRAEGQRFGQPAFVIASGVIWGAADGIPDAGIVMS